MSRRWAVILAAGQGKRMKTDLPKVLVEVCGIPMIEYVLQALAEANVGRTIMVVGHRAEQVCEALDNRGVDFALQAEQLGTGHAVMSCREQLKDYDGPVLIVAGDAPLLQSETIITMLADFEREPAACILGTVISENPLGLGRIVRNVAGDFVGIVEHKDASEEQRKITEVNMSYYVFNCRDLLAALDLLKADNAQKEYYLTDCPGLLARQGKTVRALPVLKPVEALSINTPEELAVVEEVMRREQLGASA